MASTLLPDVSAALSLVYGKQLATQINSAVPLLYLLPVKRGAGQNLNWTCEFSGAADATASAEGVARSNTDADDEQEVPASFQWAQYDKTSSVSDKAQAAAGTNMNPDSIRGGGGDLLLGRLAGQVRRLARGIARDLYAGDPAASPTQLAGAALAIDSAGTFASINPVTFTEWVSVETTQTLASVSFDSLRSFFTAIYDASGYYPEFCTCPSNVFNAIRALYSNFEAFVVNEVSLARGGGAEGEMPRVVKLLAGMRAVQVDQIPIVLDKFATTNTLYAWNTNYVSLYELPFDPVRSVLARGPEGVEELFRRIKQDNLLVLPREAVEGMVARGPGITPFVKVLGDRGLSSEAILAWFGQVAWQRRNCFGKIVFT